MGEIMIAATDGTEACDYCIMTGITCVGVAEHCRNGEHCSSHEAVCALDMAQDDHSINCCNCKQRI